MAVFTVAFDGTRVDAGDSATGWAADGVTPALNADQFYQGTGSIGAQVKTSDAGFKYTSAAQNMVGRTVLIKVNSGRPGALQGNGISIRMGSTDLANYYLWSLFSAATYPAVGGWQIVAVDPNVSQWRTGTSGTPNLSSIVYWSFRAHYTANTQGANTFADAIDHVANGNGLTGTAGTAPDAAGTFAAFVAADPDTSGNRWGVVLVQNGILFVNGTLTVGASGTATRFTSVGETLVFPAHKVTTGFCGLRLDAQNASTDIDISGALFNGRGALSGSDDTRPRLTVVGTSGDVDIVDSTFSNFEQLILTSITTLNGCAIASSGLVTQSGATLTGCTFSSPSGAVGILSGNPGLITDCTFVSKGTGHAIEITTPGTYDLDGLIFTSFAGSNGSTGNEAVYNNSGGAVTLNIVGGGTTPSIRNGAGASTTVVAGTVNVSITVVDSSATPIQNARVIVRAATGGPMPFNVTVTIANAGTTATVTHNSHGLSTGDKVQIRGASHWQNNGVFAITVTGTNTYTYTLPTAPGSNPTGTIAATFVVLEGLTNASGIISASRTYASTQPIVGHARKSSSAPFYKTGPITGSINNTTGFSTTVQLVPDQ